MVKHQTTRHERPFLSFGRGGVAMVKALSLMALVSAALWFSPAQAKAAEEVDHLALAAVLIDGGDYDRALLVLGEVNPADEDPDELRFYTLRGFAALRLGQSKRAYVDLKKASEHEGASPQVFVYLGRAAYGAERYQEALDALARAGEAGRSSPGLFELRAAIYEKLDRPGAALAALRKGQKRFGLNLPLRERELGLLVTRGLHREALARAMDGWVDRADEERLVAVTNALRQVGALTEAKTVAEAALLRFEYSASVRLALGRVYADADEPLAAASVIETAARLDSDYASDVAELYRRAGRFETATFWNARVPDVKKKTRQRFGILMEQERFSEASSLGPRLERLGLLDEDAVRLALAYARFHAGSPRRALVGLDGITDPGLFRDATDLRRAIGRCLESEELCP